MAEDEGNERIRESWGGGLFFSFLLHGSIFLTFLSLGLSFVHPEEDPPQPVEMVFDDGHAKTTAVKSDVVKNTPEPPSEKDIEAPHSPVPPTEKPPEPPPPSTPPPPPSPMSPDAKERPSDQKKMEVTPEKDELAATESPKKVEEKQEEAAVKGPKTKSDQPPVKAPPSETKQTKVASKMASDSHSLLAAIENFKSQEKQKKPPKAHPNPTPGGTTKGGGNPDGDTMALTSGEQKAMGASVRRCYEQDTGTRGYQTFQAHLSITTDEEGVVRLVEFEPETQAKMDEDPTYRAFAERARDAVLSPTCAKLPLPQRMLGEEHVFKFLFRP
ncbi:energy transducer TonB [Acetobacteraceae bacterium]|nr:energy transducer TonB [Acetobacteraceae bacterium]